MTDTLLRSRVGYRRIVRRALSLGGAAGPVLFAAVAVSCAALWPGYDHATQTISDLGARGAPHATVMNLAGFALGGLLIALFGVSLGMVRPRMRRWIAGAACIVAFGLGMIGASALHCDPGCPQPARSFIGNAHHVVSGLGFMAAVVGIGLYARAFRDRVEWRGFAAYSAVSCTLAVVLLIILDRAIRSHALVGVWQRLFLATLFQWCAVIGICGALERDQALVSIANAMDRVA